MKSVCCKIKTFTMGGIHPNDCKITKDAPIEIMPLPSAVHIPLTQHIGAPAQCLVKSGDHVKTGQLIAQAVGNVSANVHSSVSGTVQEISPMIDASGLKKMCVTIQVQGDEWIEEINEIKEIESTPPSSELILEKIKAGGIVGMGGAAFPTHVKLSPPPGKKAEYLIINAVECEPYLTSDHRLMLEKPGEIIEGVKLLMDVLNVQCAYIGIESNKKDAYTSLAPFCNTEKTGTKTIKLQLLETKYPQGGEKQLIEALFKREVPSGKLPIDIGIVVQNVASAYAVYEAVIKNKPLIERVVTVTGPALKRPRNLLVRIGTPVRKILEYCEGTTTQSLKVASGGPMMGKALYNLDVPLNKGMSGILCIGDESAERLKPQNCIRCARCVEVCAMGLEPYLLEKMGQRNLIDAMIENKIMNCIECGSCGYVCPARRPILDWVRVGKAKVGEFLRKNQKS